MTRSCRWSRSATTGYLNASRRVQVDEADVRAALADLAGAERGAVAGGVVGAGTGMSCFDLKGGIGTASRVVMPVDRRYAYDLRTDDSGRPPTTQTYTVGVLALTNFGRLPRLTIDGVRVGQALIAEGLAEESTERERGSCVIVVATDAPLLPKALERLARRAGMGIARAGSSAGHGSGDFFIAFSTGLRIPRAGGQPLRTVEAVDDEYLDPFFDAVVEATEAAVVDSLFRAETVEGRDGNVVNALPVERTLELLAAAGRLA